jgi:hypothetical protein
MTSLATPAPAMRAGVLADLLRRLDMTPRRLTIDDSEPVVKI